MTKKHIAIFISLISLFCCLGSCYLLSLVRPTPTARQLCLEIRDSPDTKCPVAESAVVFLREFYPPGYVERDDISPNLAQYRIDVIERPDRSITEIYQVEKSVMGETYVYFVYDELGLLVNISYDD